jgi:hypothetical protein
MPIQKCLFFLRSLFRRTSEANIVTKKKIIFIHNPKAAGNTLMEILGIKLKKGESTSHQTPTYLVNKKKWETYFSILAVRHPIDRLISAYNYHTKPSYQGYFLSKYPELHSFTFEQYFNVFSKEPNTIMPQVEYTRHLMSSKKVDFIIRYENLQEDVDRLCDTLNMEKYPLPHLNKSPKKQIDYFENESLKERVLNYYKEDFEYFNYSKEF